MKPISTVFFGSPPVAQQHLEFLIHHPAFQVSAVVTQPDRPAGRNMRMKPTAVAELASSVGIHLLKPFHLREQEEEFLLALRESQPEVIVVVAFGQIFPASLLAAFPGKIVNLHASLLPRWRGAAPIQRAIMAGDSETGMALQVMVPELDAGPIIGSRHLSIPGDWGASHVMSALAHLGCELLAHELIEYLNGKIQPVPQDPVLATLAPKIQKHETEINWERSATELCAMIRALDMGPHMWTTMGSLTLRLLKTQVVKLSTQQAPGSIVECDQDTFVVQAGEHGLRVFEVQPAGKKKMSAAEFMRGYRLAPGIRMTRLQEVDR